MMTSHDPQRDQPAPDLYTRPMRTQQRLGRWVWIVIAVVFIAFVLISVFMRATFFGNP